MESDNLGEVESSSHIFHSYLTCVKVFLLDESLCLSDRSELLNTKRVSVSEKS